MDNSLSLTECKKILLEYDILHKEYKKCIFKIYSKIEELEKRPEKCSKSECSITDLRYECRQRPWNCM